MKELSKFRPALAAFLLMFATSTINQALSFLNQPIATDLGVGLGTFTLYHSLMIAAGALALPFVGQLIGKLGIHKIILIAAIWGLAFLSLFSVSNALWMFYLIGIIMGLLSATAMNLVANVTLQSYYTSTETASLIGIVMAGSGVGGIFYSAAVPIALNLVGWRNLLRLLALLWFIILILARFILGHGQVVSSEKGQLVSAPGMTKKEATRSPLLYLMMASVFLLLLASGCIQHFPVILKDMGLSAAAIGAAMSFLSGVMALGKVGQGMLYAKIGIRKGSTIVYSLYLAGFVMLLHPKLIYPSFFALAIGIGALTTQIPILSKMLFGQKDYASIFSLISMAISIGAFIGTPLWGILYDVTGSYRMGFYFAPVLIAIGFLMQMTALSAREKKGIYENE